jgi:cyclopropane fatty-acyl-phospholipid synthase-like methyltransferase
MTMSRGDTGPPFLPAASHDVLTPVYDAGSALLGVGQRFKRRVVDAAGLTDGDSILDLACGTGVPVWRRWPGYVAAARAAKIDTA